MGGARDEMNQDNKVVMVFLVRNDIKRARERLQFMLGTPPSTPSAS